jgi:trans-aconitate methyltransferase
MDDRSYQRYYRVHPPGSVLREANRVARIVLLLNATLLIVRFHTSFLVAPDNVYILHMCNVIGITNSFLCLTWFTGVSGVGWYRLWKYRQAFVTLSRKIFAAVYPLLAMLILAIAVAAAWIEHATGGVDLCIVIASGLGTVLALDASITRKYAEKLLPRSVPRMFLPAMDVMLGPRLGTKEDNYIGNVLHFAGSLEPDGNKQQIPHHCAAMYSAPDVFEAFQATLSSPDETAPFVSTKIARRINRKQPWTMVDIGCGDGSFTAKLLSELPTLPTNIVGLDPAQEMLDEFKETLMSKFPKVQLSLRRGRVEDDVAWLENSDLLLASHSLYSILDRNRAEAQAVVRTLLGKAKLAVFVLASKRSRAYAVKRAVYERFALTDKSSFGSDLVEVLGEVHAETFVRDSLMDVSELLKDDALLLKWYSYFCRLEIETLEPELSFLKSVLQHCSMPLNCLPEGEISGVGKPRRWRAIRSAKDDIRVLMHKEDIVIVTGQVNETEKVAGLHKCDQNKL